MKKFILTLFSKLSLLKRFVFPFSNETYSFLEDKWRHRLTKTIFFVLLSIGTIISYIVLTEIVFEYQEQEEIETKLVNITNKMTVQEFAQKIKTKYPEYKDIDDTELTNKILAKYPEYRDQLKEEIDYKHIIN